MEALLKDTMIMATCLFALSLFALFCVIVLGTIVIKCNALTLLLEKVTRTIGRHENQIGKVTQRMKNLEKILKQREEQDQEILTLLEGLYEDEDPESPTLSDDSQELDFIEDESEVKTEDNEKEYVCPKFTDLGLDLSPEEIENLFRDTKSNRFSTDDEESKINESEGFTDLPTENERIIFSSESGQYIPDKKKKRRKR